MALAYALAYAHRTAFRGSVPGRPTGERHGSRIAWCGPAAPCGNSPRSTGQQRRLSLAAVFRFDPFGALQPTPVSVPRQPVAQTCAPNLALHVHGDHPRKPCSKDEQMRKSPCSVFGAQYLQNLVNFQCAVTSQGLCRLQFCGASRSAHVVTCKEITPDSVSANTPI